uniref:Uncharacterized protein n=1 Tax=Populus davidiana TaxID=266767 RepID=A0A6M2EEP9_9ROSI
MDMPAFSKFFIDFGFFLFLICRGRGDCEDDGINVGFLGLLLVLVSVFAVCTVSFVSVLWVSSVYAGFFFSSGVLASRTLELGFLLPFIEKIAPQPVLPLQDCYGIHDRDRGQETGS